MKLERELETSAKMHTKKSKIFLFFAVLAVLGVSAIVFSLIKFNREYMGRLQPAMIAAKRLDRGTMLADDLFVQQQVISDEEPFVWDTFSCPRPRIKVGMVTGEVLLKSYVDCNAPLDFAAKEFPVGGRIYSLVIDRENIKRGEEFERGDNIIIDILSFDDSKHSGAAQAKAVKIYRSVPVLLKWTRYSPDGKVRLFFTVNNLSAQELFLAQNTKEMEIMARKAPEVKEEQ